MNKIFENQLYSRSVFSKSAGSQSATLLKMKFFTDVFQEFCWWFILAKCSKPTCERVYFLFELHAGSQYSHLSIQIWTLHLWLCMFACVVSYIFLSNFSTFEFCCCFFINLGMHWLIYRPGWFIKSFITEAVIIMDWFLYDNGVRHERVTWDGANTAKRLSSPHVMAKYFQDSLLLITGLVLKWRRVPCRAASEPVLLMKSPP